jgi:ribosomal protein L5
LGQRRFFRFLRGVDSFKKAITEIRVCRVTGRWKRVLRDGGRNLINEIEIVKVLVSSRAGESTAGRRKRTTEDGELLQISGIKKPTTTVYLSCDSIAMNDE